MRFLILLLAAAAAGATKILLRSYAAQLSSLTAANSASNYVASMHCGESSYSRRAALAGSIAALTVGACSPALALLPQRDFQQAKPPAAARLLPIVRIRAHVEKIAASLEDATKWDAVRTELRAPDLSKANFRRVFDEYSSENWYVYPSWMKYYYACCMNKTLPLTTI
jgi:hypothetical protein